MPDKHTDVELQAAGPAFVSIVHMLVGASCFCLWHTTVLFTAWLGLRGLGIGMCKTRDDFQGPWCRLLRPHPDRSASIRNHNDRYG